MDKSRQKPHLRRERGRWYYAAGEIVGRGKTPAKAYEDFWERDFMRWLAEKPGKSCRKLTQAGE